jgi:hypothetical protein
MNTLQRAILSGLMLAAALPVLSANPPAEEQSVGLLSKVVQEVSHKASGKDWSKATRGQMLTAGDAVKTGTKSFAIIKFKDNSLVRVRELTEVTVTGMLQGKAFSKTVELQGGVVGFNVTKQRAGEEFRFNTPTSVASIRGTGGSFARGIADTLVVVEGVVNLLNRISSKATDVQAGYTGISREDGTIETRLSTQGERASALEAMRTGDQPKQLKLEIRNSQGEKKDLIIDYKD